MKDFEGKVAVVTGAASGIGWALVQRFATEGMKVVLADIEQGALTKAESEMKGQGATVLAVRTDISKAGDVEALAEKTLDAFGAVHVLCNNAGVVNPADRPLWECTLAELEWVMGVNVWGVIHGVRVFVPIMLEQDTECHIVNTGSTGGLVSTPDDAIYTMTKHGVVALSETIRLRLAKEKTKIKVSVLCPGFTNTQLVEAARNRRYRLCARCYKKGCLPAKSLIMLSTLSGKKSFIFGLTLNSNRRWKLGCKTSSKNAIQNCIAYPSFCMETPAEAVPTPPDARRGNPARWFPDKNYPSRLSLCYRICPRSRSSRTLSSGPLTKPTGQLGSPRTIPTSNQT